MKRIALIGCICLLAGSFLQAQNTKNYTPVNMYMLNPLLVNPAYSGARESLSFTVMGGGNLIEIPGPNFLKSTAAGTLASGTFDTPIGNEKNSVGVTLINNNFGVNNNFVAYGHYAYRIITGAGRLSFGLRAGYTSYSRNLTRARFRQVDDPLRQDFTRGYPNFGAGVYWYSEDYYVGLSVPDFFFPPTGPETFSHDFRYYNYTLMGGYLFRINENFKIKPSTMLTYSIGSPMAYQANLSFIMFQDRIWAGLGYKPEGVLVILEAQMGSPLRIGLAYEYPTGGLINYSRYGSVELLIRWDMSFKLRTVSPAYFY